MLGAGETVIGQTRKLISDPKARGLYRLAGEGAEVEKRRGVGPQGRRRGLDRSRLLVRHARMEMIERPSPNFDERAFPVSMIVLHYTGMPDAESALNRLTSPEAKVSAHYLVDEDGSVFTTGR